MAMGRRMGNSRVYGVTRGGKGSGKGFSLAVQVTPDVQRLKQQLPRQFRFIMPKATTMAINRTMSKVRAFTHTQLAREMGVKRKDLNNVIRVKKAYAMNMSSLMMIREGPLKVSTDRFDPKWGKGMGGVSHKAWGRRQVTPGSFMLPGLKIAFLNVPGARTRNNKQKLKPVWGPWAARKFWDPGQLNKDMGPTAPISTRAERCAQRELPFQLVSAMTAQVGRATGRIKPARRGMPRRPQTRRRQPRRPPRKC